MLKKHKELKSQNPDGGAGGGGGGGSGGYLGTWKTPHKMSLKWGVFGCPTEVGREALV